MARRPPPSPPSAPLLGLEEIKSAIQRLQRRIDELEAFDPEKVEHDDPRIGILSSTISGTLRDIFGDKTEEFYQYSAARQINTAPIRVGHPTPPWEVIEGLVKGRRRAIETLKQAQKNLTEKLEFMGQATVSSRPEVANRPRGRDVIIIHGRDDAAKLAVARFLEKARFNAIILHEQPNKGATVIEKLERQEVGFAVALLTPDDEGRLKGDATLRPRARQNVVAELFYFMARLGRDRVAAFIRDDVENPSDFGGVVYEKFDDGDGWKSLLLRELEAAGYEVDWSALSSRSRQ